MKWGEESRLKFDFAGRVAKGRNKGFSSATQVTGKIVTVVIGDCEESALADIEQSLNR